MSWVIVGVTATVLGAGIQYMGIQEAEKERNRLRKERQEALRQQDEYQQQQLNLARQLGTERREAAQEANLLARENLDFQKEQFQKNYDRWESLYGKTEANLSDFYNNLSPEKLIATGLSSQAQSHANLMGRLQQNVAQRGVDTPATLLLEQTLEMQDAQNRANLRLNAPLQVAQMQEQHLSRGQQPSTQGVSQGLLGSAGIQLQGSQITDPTLGTLSDLARSAGQTASDLQGQINTTSDTINQGYAGLGQTVVGGIEQYGYSQANKENEQLNKPNTGVVYT